MFNFYVKYLDSATNSFVDVNSFVRPIRNKETLDETHDITKIFLSMDSREEAFPPFTHFIIQIDEVDDNTEAVVDTLKLYRVVGTDKVIQQTFVEPYLYSHDIVLYEAAKELERAIVDNLTFTNTFASLYIINKADWVDDSYVVPGFWRTEYKSFMVPWPSFSYMLSAAPPEYTTEYIINTPITIQYVYARSGDVYKRNITPLKSIWTQYDITYTANTLGVNVTNPSGIVTQVAYGEQYTPTTKGKYTVSYTIHTNTLKTRKTAWGAGSETIADSYSGHVTRTYTFYVVDALTPESMDRLSIYDVLKRLVLTASNPLITHSGVEQKYLLDSSLLERYGSIEAPEFMFTGKTLWDCLVGIGGRINAIPYLNISSDYSWNIIDYFDLGEHIEEPTTSSSNQFIEYSNEYDTENYTSSFNTYVDNMICPLESGQGLIHDPAYGFGRSYRSETIEISEDNLEINTQYPIYKINSVYFRRNDGTLFNISTRVLSEALYNSFAGYPSSANDYSWKGFLLYYTPGGSSIKGLTYKVSSNSWAAASEKIAIKNILDWVQGAAIGTGLNFDLGKNQFIIEYIPFFNSRVITYKTNAPALRLTGSMFQNQSANIIDSTHLGRNLVSVLGRTGNRSDTQTYNAFNFNELPTKGMVTTDKYFVNTVEYSYGRNKITARVDYIKQYQKISEWVNINSEQRYYQISENQATDRYINTDMFYVFSSQQPSTDFVTPWAGLNADLLSGMNDNVMNYNYLSSLLVDRFSHDGHVPTINGSVLTVRANNSRVARLYLPTIATALGNQILLSTDAITNYGAGSEATDYVQANDTQAYLQQEVPYSNAEGYIDTITIYNVTDTGLSFSSNAITAMANLGGTLPDINYNFVYTTSGGFTIYSPMLDSTSWDSYFNNTEVPYPATLQLGAAQLISIQKDNREIIHLRQGFHFLTEDSDIVVGSAMTEKCRFIQNIEFGTKVAYLNRYINPYELTIPDSAIVSSTNITSSNTNMILSSDYNARSITIEGETSVTALPFIEISANYNSATPGASLAPVAGKAWALLTQDNEVILAYNCGDFAAGDYIPNVYQRCTDDYLIQ